MEFQIYCYKNSPHALYLRENHLKCPSWKKITTLIGGQVAWSGSPGCDVRNDRPNSFRPTGCFRCFPGCSASSMLHGPGNGVV